MLKCLMFHFLETSVKAYLTTLFKSYFVQKRNKIMKL